MKLSRLALCAFLLFTHAKSWAVSAAPVEVWLTQADDGAVFWAVPHGGERRDWIETLDGYSIVEAAGVWYYAEQEPGGTLGVTPFRANGAPPPTRAPWPKHLHPP